MKYKKLFSTILGVLALATVLASCNHSDSALVISADVTIPETNTVAEPSRTNDAGEAAVAYGDLPAVTVVRPVAGTKHNLIDLVDKSKPTLIWFWAPTCPVCRAEAPKLEEIATQNLDNFTVIGLGSLDDLPTAKNFEKFANLKNVDLVWDDPGPGFAPGESWNALGTFTQTTWLLLDAAGKIIIPLQYGSPDESRILETIGI